MRLCLHACACGCCSNASFVVVALYFPNTRAAPDESIRTRYDVLEGGNKLHSHNKAQLCANRVWSFLHAEACAKDEVPQTPAGPIQELTGAAFEHAARQCMVHLVYQREFQNPDGVEMSMKFPLELDKSQRNLIRSLAGSKYQLYCKVKRVGLREGIETKLDHHKRVIVHTAPPLPVRPGVERTYKYLLHQLGRCARMGDAQKGNIDCCSWCGRMCWYRNTLWEALSRCFSCVM